MFWVASVATFLVSLDTTMLFAAFDPLRHAFPGATPAEISWVLNAYTVVYATMLIPAGGLADAHGRKRVFLIGVALFLAAAVGPSAGSFVIDHFGWPWAFYINLPLGGLALWRGVSRLQESEKAAVRRRVDGIGMGLLMLAVGAITLAIVESDSPGWTRLELLALMLAGLVAAGAFVAWARRARAPLVDLALFRHRTYRYVNLATLVFGTGFSMMFLTFFFFMMNVWDFSLPQAGLAVAPGPLLVMPTAIVTGRLAARLGHRRFLVGGSLLYACSSQWFLLVPGSEPDYLSHWLPGLVMSGVAVGLVLPSLSAAAVSRLPVEHYAVGSAVNQATRQIGSVLGVAITVALLGHAALQLADFHALYLLHGALALLTGLLCLPVDTRPQALTT